MKPLAIDLFCGLGGWTAGLLAEGYDVVGFDIERHEYPERVARNGDVKIGGGANVPGVGWTGFADTGASWRNREASGDGALTGRIARYPGQLVVQDVLTLHGSQFKDAALIVASPPCQEYSYMAMPWKLAKAKAAAIRADTTGQMLADLNRLFHACFRIQAEASMAAGRHVPMVVENVRGAQPWVGRARWNFGSFYLWGDVPALMPWTSGRAKARGNDWNRFKETGEVSPHWNVSALKVPGFRFDGGGSFQSASVRRTNKGNGVRFTSRDCGVEGIKNKDANGYERSHPNAFGRKSPSTTSSNTSARKQASAMIAKIPLALSRHIASVYR